MTPSTESDVNKRMKSIELDQLGQKLGDIAAIADLEASDDRLKARIEFGLPLERAFDELRDELSRKTGEMFGISEVELELGTRIVAHGVQRNLKPLDNVRNVIAVASG